MSDTTKAKHTPGPWEVDYSGPARLGIVDRDDRLLALCNLEHEDGDEDEANARLIAAAPAMLGALRGLLDCCELNMDDMEPETVGAIDAARAALSAATGEG